jgi:alkyl hydroperoxide reductase subunit AhpF
MMTPSEEKQILTLNERLSKEIQIELIQTDHEKSPAIRKFCDELIQRVPKIRVKKEAGDPGAVPAIQIHNGLRYQAVPSGTEVGPFIEALQLKDSGTARIKRATEARLAKIDLLYMLGEMGRRQSIALLQSVLADKYSVEVKEAAREALDKVKSRIAKK